MVETASLPTVDMMGCGIDNENIDEESMEPVGYDVYKAFSTVGFVYLRNTGVSMRDVEETMKISKQFFDLSPDVKCKYVYDENYSGYHKLYTEGTNVNRPKDIKEAYNVGGMALASGKGHWPDAEVEGFSDTMAKFYDICRRLTLRILELLAVGMKIKDKEYFIKCHSRIGKERNYTILRTLYYPPIPDDVKPGQIRLGEHSDYGTITLLFQDHIGGLEVENLDGQYIPANPIPGTVIVNIGDLLQFWTKGKLKSTKHRIRNPIDEEKRKSFRQSIVYFANPNFEVKLSEIEYDGCPVIENHTPVECEFDENLTAVEYNERMLRNTYK
ncbi:uncharacterized protein LOC120336891 [Styela clava]